jgi:hypothetical protein
MGERERGKDVPAGSGGSDPGQVPGQERYGEPPVGETPPPDAEPARQPRPDEDEGLGGKEVGDPTSQVPPPPD